MCQFSVVESKSATFPSEKQRSLLDDSVLESQSPVRNSIPLAAFTNGISIGRSKPHLSSPHTAWFWQWNSMHGTLVSHLNLYSVWPTAKGTNRLRLKRSRLAGQSSSASAHGPAPPNLLKTSVLSLLLPSLQLATLLCTSEYGGACDPLP